MFFLLSRRNFELGYSQSERGSKLLNFLFIRKKYLIYLIYVVAFF